MASGHGLSGLSLPWYGYLGIGALVLAFGQSIAKVANEAIKEMEEDEDTSDVDGKDNNAPN